MQLAGLSSEGLAAVCCLYSGVDTVAAAAAAYRCRRSFKTVCARSRDYRVNWAGSEQRRRKWFLDTLAVLVMVYVTGLEFVFRSVGHPSIREIFQDA